MRKVLLASIALFCLSAASYSQPAWQNNGKFDDFSELSTSFTVPFTMPDGIKLYTDVYLPVVQDCLVVPITIPVPLVGDITRDLMLIPKGTQIIIYDSINGQPNPNPFQLPMVFSRTPYKKGNGRNVEGSVISMLGYAYAVQDMRGRYTSEGVYLPLLSDSWDKNSYHPNWQHVLDRTLPNDPANGNKHEDGFHSINYIVNNLTRDFDLDFDGIVDTTDLLTNGRIGMFGASALGYNQYQAAAAHRIDPTQPGLKCILPIVAPGDFYKSTGFGNGVLRDRLVTGWLKGQIFTGTEDERIPEDEAIMQQTDTLTATQNDIHSSFDYDLPKKVTFNGVEREYQQNKFDAANLAIDHFVSMRYPDLNGNLGPCGYYPNSVGRTEMDISHAMVDANGEGDMNGTISRYTNMEVPAYHLTGWWDIFIDGQIDTWAQMREHLDPAKGNKFKQKLVVGPWAHQTMGQVTTGDRTYPDNVTDILGFNLDDFDEGSDIPIAKALKSEIISWFRYNLNYQPDQYIGEPKAIIPESQTYTSFSENFLEVKLRIPAEDLVLRFEELIALLNGTGGVNNVKVETIVGTSLTGYTTSTFNIDIPSFGTPLVEGLENTNITGIPYRDFGNPADVPDVRVYVVGPNDDNMPENAHKGNYWLASDTFPLPENTGNITRTKFYLHKNGKLDHTAPTTDEGYKIYVHDPDNPVRCVGGANMIVRTPDGERNSQGQFNIKDPRYAEYTIDRPGVIQFETDVIEQDSMCVVGFPVATLYAKTNPGGVLTGPTDTDFFVRIIDVYPDGREYFVVEGCVNARARHYAKALVDNPAGEKYPFENDQIPFTNIEIGKIEEYKFNLLPIGYTFGKGHKMKVLISSSLYTRWQVNPNLPINDGEFFRRKPGDGRKYIFNGVEMSPRVATQRVAFAPEYPTNIDLPIYSGTYIAVEEPGAKGPEIVVYPNPTVAEVNVVIEEKSNYELTIFDVSGKVVKNPTLFKNRTTVNIEDLDAGTYFIQVMDTNSNEKTTKKITKQ